MLQCVVDDETGFLRKHITQKKILPLDFFQIASKVVITLCADHVAAVFKQCVDTTISLFSILWTEEDEQRQMTMPVVDAFLKRMTGKHKIVRDHAAEAVLFFASCEYVGPVLMVHKLARLMRCSSARSGAPQWLHVLKSVHVILDHFGTRRDPVLPPTQQALSIESLSSLAAFLVENRHADVRKAGIDLALKVYRLDISNDAACSRHALGIDDETGVADLISGRSTLMFRSEAFAKGLLKIDRECGRKDHESDTAIAAAASNESDDPAVRALQKQIAEMRKLMNQMNGNDGASQEKKTKRKKRQPKPPPDESLDKGSKKGAAEMGKTENVETPGPAKEEVTTEPLATNVTIVTGAEEEEEVSKKVAEKVEHQEEEKGEQFKERQETSNEIEEPEGKGNEKGGAGTAVDDGTGDHVPPPETEKTVLAKRPTVVTSSETPTPLPAPRQSSTAEPTPENRKKQVVLMKQIRDAKIKLKTEGDSMPEAEKATLEDEIAGQLKRLQGLRNAAGQRELAEHPSSAAQSSAEKTGVDATAVAGSNDGAQPAQPVQEKKNKIDDADDDEKEASTTKTDDHNKNSTSGKAAVARLKSTSKVIGKAGQAGKKKGDCNVM